MSARPDPIPYAPAVLPRQRAARLRGALLAIGALSGLVGAATLVLPELLQKLGWESAVGLWGTPLMPINSVADRPLWYARHELEFDATYVGVSLLFLGAVLWAQWAMLAPAGSWRPRVTEHGRPTRRAAVAAGLIAMLLSIAMLASVLELLGAWSTFTARDVIRGTGYPEVIQDFRVLWIGMLALWSVWAVLFWRYFRTVNHRTAVSRVLRWLLAGSVLNVLIAAPVQASRTGDCYCAKGSYTGLVFGFTVIVWLFGPAVFMLYWRELRRADAAKIGYPAP